MVRLDLFRDRRFALINLSNVLIYMTNFSIMLLVPFYFSRITTLSLPAAGLVLATGAVGMFAASTPAGWLVARYGSGKVAPAGAFLLAIGLGCVGLWGSGTSAGMMVAAQLVQGIGVGLFQVASMEIVMGTMPVAQRGVAGSLVQLTRVIGVVTAASVLTMGFHAFEAGPDATTAFLAGFRAIFRIVAVVAAATGLVIAWAAHRPEAD
jgi:MFS family permease